MLGFLQLPPFLNSDPGPHSTGTPLPLPLPLPLLPTTFSIRAFLSRIGLSLSPLVDSRRRVHGTRKCNGIVKVFFGDGFLVFVRTRDILAGYHSERICKDPLIFILLPKRSFYFRAYVRNSNTRDASTPVTIFRVTIFRVTIFRR